MGNAAIIIGWIAAIAVYWIPAIVAGARHVPNAGSVTVINLFLGWTLVGWVVALAMACRSRPQTVTTQMQPQLPPSAPQPGHDNVRGYG